MKKTIIIVSVVVVLLGAVTGAYFLGWFSGLGLAPITGYSEQFIGFAAAKQAALEDQGLTGDEAYHLHADFENEHGSTYYEVEFIANGMEYDYIINAVDGKIIDFSKEVDD